MRYVGSVKALSPDLRQRIADALDARQSQASVARRFDVSLSSVERLARKRRQGHSLEPGKSPGKKPLVAHEQQQGGETLSQATVLRTLRRIGLAYKKSAASPVNATRTSAKRVPD